MDWGDYIRFVLALVFVLALIGLFTWLVRRFGLGARVRPMRGHGRRLRIVEVAAVDAKHRVVLVRRDRTEHLVLLGGGSDVVIESGIAAPADSGPTDSGPAESSPAVSGPAEKRA